VYVCNFVFFFVPYYIFAEGSKKTITTQYIQLKENKIEGGRKNFKTKLLSLLLYKNNKNQKKNYQIILKEGN
jgi:hypothetical protein